MASMSASNVAYVNFVKSEKSLVFDPSEKQWSTKFDASQAEMEVCVERLNEMVTMQEAADDIIPAVSERIFQFQYAVETKGADTLVFYIGDGSGDTVAVGGCYYSDGGSDLSVQRPQIGYCLPIAGYLVTDAYINRIDTAISNINSTLSGINDELGTVDQTMANLNDEIVAIKRKLGML